MPPVFFNHRFQATAVVACLGLSACHRLDERMEITEKRDVSVHATLPKALASSAERFYDNQPDQSKVPQENPLQWSTPEGWSEAKGPATPGSMRLIDLRFGDHQEGECYLSAMPGKAGGLEANVNRWRTQMGQPPYTPEELEKLPKKQFLNRDATFVTFEGDFKGVGAAEAAKGYRLMGLVQAAPEFTLFVKLTGPKEVVQKNEAAFEQFCQSISIKR